MITAYLILLIISPQDWVGALLGLPVDYILYPIWAVVLLMTGRSRPLLRMTHQDWIVLLFVTWIAVSALANYSSGVDWMRLYLYLKWFVLYKLVAATLTTMKRLRRTGVVVALLALVLAAESIQHFHSADLLGWAGQSLGWIAPEAMDAGVPGRTRWVSIFDGPGVFCVVFTLALPFVLQYVGRPYDLLRRFGAVLVLVPLLLAIYYTGSRGGFLATLAVVGLHLGARTRISVTKVVAVGVVLAALFVAAPAYMTEVYDDNNSAQHRVDMWIEGFQMVRYNPVFGIGRGHFADYTGALIAHNSAIEISGETGLPGITLWIAMLVISFRTLLVYQRRPDVDPFDRTYALALGISLAGYLVSAMFVTLEYETLYFLIGMTGAVGLQLDEPVRMRRRDAAIVMGLVVAFFASLRLFIAIYY